MALVELSFESGETSLSVREFSVREEMSAPFEIHIIALSPKEDIDFDTIAGRPASFAMEGGHGGPRRWSGVCSQIGLVQAEETGLSTYELAIAPRLWLLSHRSGHRVFQHKSALEIVTGLLAEWTIEPEIRVSGGLPKLEYRVQYGESDLAFVDRTLADAGLSYFFDGPKSRLVITDSPERGERRPGLPIPYVDNPNDAAQREYMSQIHIARGVRPTKVTIRDFDLRRRTDYKLVGEAGGGRGDMEDMLEQYHFAHGSSVVVTPRGSGDTPVADEKGAARHDDKELSARAERALQARRADKRRVTFESNATDLSPGSIFSVDHPHESLRASEALLCIKSLVFGSHDGEWGVSGEAVFASQPYRPPLPVSKPRMEGVQSAVVIGPPGEEIHTDEMGRVRVRFHWDREGHGDDFRTAWLRVSQVWAGSMFGGMMIPRVGQEVLVDFFDGDPDQPIIIGRFFNQTSQGPYGLPANKTRTAWRTQSSPGGGGYNEISFEDSASGELVYLQAERDLALVVGHDEAEMTEANRSLVVGKSQSTNIGECDTIAVGGQHAVKMVKPTDLAILGQGAPAVEELSTKVEVSEKRIRITTGDATILLDGPTIMIESKTTIGLLAGGQLVIQGGPNVYLNCDCPPAPKGQAACLLSAARTGAAFVQRAP